VEASEPYRKRYQEEAKQLHQNDILRLIKLVNDLEQSIRWSPQPRFKLEAGLLQMIKLERSVQIDTLLGQIDELKKKLSSGGNSSTGSGSGLRTAPPSESPTELKVVGQVSAGRLRSSSLNVTASAPLEEPRQSFSPQSTTITTVAPPAAQAAPPSGSETAGSAEPMKKITAEEAYEQWQQWVTEVRKVKIGIGTILGESSILDVTDGAIRIACPDDYHFSSLKRHKEFLVDSFQRVTGLKLRIEPVLYESLGGNSATSSSVVRPDVSKSPTTTPSYKPNGGSGAEHPIILALRRELGAEPIE
jgi:hypothetical protein